MKQVILTGLRANNDLHIGNYLGALLPIIDIAKQKDSPYQINLFVPDLHSFTTPINHQNLQKQILDNLKVYVAAGLPLNSPNVLIYRQSYISAHSELTWILDCFTGFGEMNRMTQFKDKSKKQSEDRISMGLFNYPVLMAADILLYDASYVPVGDDQTQHLEFARNIAERMNKLFGEIFVVPLTVEKQHKFFGKDQGIRIRDLIYPGKKMSKSDESGKGVIFLTDPADIAQNKIISATTDSYSNIQHDYQKQPGISNLLDIYQLLGGDPKEFISKQQYGPFKSAVSQKVVKFLNDFQTKLTEIDEKQLIQKLEHDEIEVKKIAQQKLFQVQKAVGLR